MKVLLISCVLAFVFGNVQASRRERCPSSDKVQLMDPDELNKAPLCLSDGECGQEEKCCRTPSGPRCLDTVDQDKYTKKDDDDDDDDCDDEEKGSDYKKRKSKCHRHTYVHPLIITAIFLIVVLFIIVMLTFIRKFCTRARSKIGNSRTDLNTVSGGMKGRASDYTVKSKSTDEDKPCKNEKTPHNWMDTSPPPPYFMAPSAPPAYTVDPPPKYKQTANQDEKIRY